MVETFDPIPNRRAQKKYCRFHKDHSHTTEECRDLKGQIKELILKGKLQKFVRKKDHHYWAEEKPKQVDVKRDEEQDARVIVGKIRMINGGPVT